MSDLRAIINLASQSLERIGGVKKEIAEELKSVGGDALDKIDRLESALAASEKAREEAELRVAQLEEAIQRALDDEESGEGWGPDVTVCGYLRKALTSSPSAAPEVLRAAEARVAQLEEALRESITVQQRIQGDTHWRTPDNSLWPDLCASTKRMCKALTSPSPSEPRRGESEAP